MIPYNTDLEKLVLPEYGRLIQDMVKICGAIEDREERNLFAQSIVEAMKMMIQEKGNVADDRKYWDHLFLISGNSIDIDSPFGRPEDAILHPTPQKIPYSHGDVAKRNYGKILQKLVDQTAHMPNSADKDACVELLANHIKKLMVVNEEEGAGNDKVYSDLSMLSSGSIMIEEGLFDLPDFTENKPSKNQKRKKNR